MEYELIRLTFELSTVRVRIVSLNEWNSFRERGLKISPLQTGPKEMIGRALVFVPYF